MIKKCYTTNSTDTGPVVSDENHVEILSNMEENALRYFAGYLCHKVEKQIVTSTNHTNKSILLSFLSKLDGYEDDTENNTEAWEGSYM